MLAAGWYPLLSVVRTATVTNNLRVITTRQKRIQGKIIILEDKQCHTDSWGNRGQ